MEKNKKQFSFDLLNLIDCDNIITPNRENRENRNGKEKEKENTNICNSLINKKPFNPLNKKKRKCRKKNLLDTSSNEKEHKFSSLNYSIENEEFESELNTEGNDSMNTATTEASTTVFNKKKRKRKNTYTKKCNKNVYTCEQGKEKRKEQNEEHDLDWKLNNHNCNNNPISNSNDINCNEIEKNEQVTETLSIISKLDNELIKKYRECSNCKLYLKELTKRKYRNFFTWNEYINENDQNLLFLKNNEIKDLQKKNSELIHEVKLLKKRNMHLTDKMESINSNAHVLSQQLEKIIEENTILKEMNGNLINKLILEKKNKSSCPLSPNKLNFWSEMNEVLKQDENKNAGNTKNEYCLDNEIFSDLI